MSDRRTVVLIVAILTAVAGLSMTVGAAVSWPDPVTISGELGTRVDIGSELLLTLVAGLLLLAGGTVTAVGLIRRQLRRVLP